MSPLKTQVDTVTNTSGEVCNPSLSTHAPKGRGFQRDDYNAKFNKTFSGLS